MRTWLNINRLENLWCFETTRQEIYCPGFLMLNTGMFFQPTLALFIIEPMVWSINAPQVVRVGLRSNDWAGLFWTRWSVSVCYVRDYRVCGRSRTRIPMESAIMQNLWEEERQQTCVLVMLPDLKQSSSSTIFDRCENVKGMMGRV